MIYGTLCLRGRLFDHILGGWGMRLLGSRLRQRRRQLKLHQKDVAGEQSASFLSKVENGAAHPSLKTLREWSQVLHTNPGHLMGDHLILEAAKYCILLTEKCHGYLDYLPVTLLTTFLRELSSSASSLSIRVPDPPPDPELQYLTAKVLLKRGMIQEAKEMAEGSLAQPCSPFIRIQYLSLLCLIYDELAEGTRRRQAQDDLRSALLELDHKKLVHKLPDADTLCVDDLNLLKLGVLLFSTDCLL